jgi:hypothetical protein
MKIRINSIYPLVRILTVTLFTLLFSNCFSEDGQIPTLILDNRQWSPFSKADSLFRIHQFVNISEPVVEEIGVDLLFFLPFNSSVIVADKYKGISCIDFNGEPIWRVTPSALGVNDFTPLYYAFYDKYSGRICAMSADRKVIRCYGLDGAPMGVVEVPADHDNAIMLDDQTLLAETNGVYPSSLRFERSNLLSMFKDGDAIKGFRSHSNRAVGNVRYSYGHNLKWQGDKIVYSRPHLDTIYFFNEQTYSLKPAVAFMYLERHAPKSSFENRGIKNALSYFSENNFVQPIWSTYIDERLYSCFDYNYQNNFLIASGSKTILNTNILEVENVAMMAPTLLGDNGYFASYYPAQKNKLLQHLKSLNYVPNNVWKKEFNASVSKKGNQSEGMVLFVLKAVNR